MTLPENLPGHLAAVKAENESLRAQLSDANLAREKLERELADLKHDIARHVEIATEHLNRAEAAEAALAAARAEARKAWKAARKTLPPDPNLNAPWSQAIAIMDEWASALKDSTC